MLTEKQKKRYIETKQYQRDCSDLNQEFNNMLNNIVEDMNRLNFINFQR